MHGEACGVEPAPVVPCRHVRRAALSLYGARRTRPGPEAPASGAIAFPGMAYRRRSARPATWSRRSCAGGNTIAPDNYRHVEEAIDRGLNYLDTAPAYGRGRSELGYAKVIAGAKRERVFVNTKVSVWNSNRNALFQRIFDSLSESERARFRTKVREELERRRALDPDHICHYFGGQQKALEASLLSNVMEAEFGHKIDRPAEYRERVLKSVDDSLRERSGRTTWTCSWFPTLRTAPTRSRRSPKSSRRSSSCASPARCVTLPSRATAIRAVSWMAQSSPASTRPRVVAYNIVNHAYVDGALDRARQAELGVIAMKGGAPVPPRSRERAAQTIRAESP